MAKKKQYLQGVEKENQGLLNRDARIQKILDDTGAALTAEGVEYLVAAVDRQPESEDGGKVHVQHDMKSDSFIFVLDAVTQQAREDLVRIGMWVGAVLSKKNGG